MLFISKQIASVFFKLVIWRRSAGSLHFFLFLKKWNRWLNAAFSVPWYNCRIRDITGKEKPQWMKLQRKKEAAGSRRRIPCRFCRSLSASSGCMPCRSAWSALPGSGCPRWNAGWMVRFLCFLTLFADRDKWFFHAAPRFCYSVSMMLLQNSM